MEQLKNSLTNVEQFIDKAKRYSNIEELSPELLRLFIERIVVSEKAKRYSRTAEQKVWIYYLDVRLMDIPFEDNNKSDDFRDFDGFDEDDESDGYDDCDGYIPQHAMALTLAERST